MPNNRPRRTPEFIAQVRALAADGHTVAQMEAIVGASEPTIRKALAGVEVTDRRIRLAPEQIARIGELRALGWGSKRIGREIGCASSTVEYYYQDQSGGSAIMRRATPKQQRVAASATHREGVDVTPDAPALAPNSIAISLRERGFPVPEALATQRTHKPRVERTVAAARSVIRKVVSQGPFRLGLHANNMQEPSR